MNCSVYVVKEKKGAVFNHKLKIRVLAGCYPAGGGYEKQHIACA